MCMSSPARVSSCKAWRRRRDELASGAGAGRWPFFRHPAQKPLLGIRLSVPENATLSNTAKLSARLITSTQEGPSGRDPRASRHSRCEWQSRRGSGYYAAENGIVETDINLTLRHDPGTWEVRIKELGKRNGVREMDAVAK